MGARVIATSSSDEKIEHLKRLGAEHRAHQKDMIRAIEATGLEPIIDRCFALEEISQAFEFEEAGKHFSKICLEF